MTLSEALERTTHDAVDRPARQRISRARAYASLAERIVRSNLTRLEHPYKLTYATTYWCNYRCKTCNIWERSPTDELRLGEIQRFFARSNDFRWIDLTGGEVFLRKDFLGIVETILSQCTDLVLLHFPTNGFLTDKVVAATRQIAAWEPKKLIITVSVDGDEATNDDVRGIDGGWRRQLATFRQLHEIPGVQVVLGMTLSVYNSNRFDVAFDAARRECPWLDHRDFHVNVAHRSAHYYGNEDGPLREGHEETLIAELDRYRALRGLPLGPVAFLEHEYLRRVERYLRTGVTPVRCQALRASCFVDPFGVVYPCGMYSKPMGSLRDVDFDLRAIWNAPATVATQREIWDGQCPQCWTPCEAYQSILGSLVRPAPRFATPSP